MANADETPVADAMALAEDLDASQVSQLEVSEKLIAIGSAKVPYGIGGAARLIGGFTLLAAGIYLWRVFREYNQSSKNTAPSLLAASGLASAVSGACAIVLTSLAPEPQATVVLTPGGDVVQGAEETLFTIRWAAGAFGFALAGLALVALAPLQWQMGGVLRVAGVAASVVGVAMLFIWVDAATIVHRISGIAFLAWLIAAGFWLAISGMSPQGRQPQAI
jgi:hypothetical protein